MNVSDPVKREQERQFIEEGMTVWREKKAIEAARELEEQRQLRLMFKNYNPWGKPGNGAPIPGSTRKAKWNVDEPQPIQQENTALAMGKPGHGAPLRTTSGRTKTKLQTDPNLRFQFNSRRSVENELRYHNTPEEKENYRRQLESLIAQKSEMRQNVSTPTPRAMERCKQGWSSETTLRRLPQHETEQMFTISGNEGVELVPLLARHRASPRRPLPTTDITRISRIQNGPPKTTESELRYHRELSSQVCQRQQKQHDERIEDMLKNQKHHDTWKGLWGRPGHGAPKGCNLVREKLNVILYEVPARRLSAV